MPRRCESLKNLTLEKYLNLPEMENGFDFPKVCHSDIIFKSSRLQRYIVLKLEKIITLKKSSNQKNRT